MTEVTTDKPAADQSPEEVAIKRLRRGMKALTARVAELELRLGVTPPTRIRKTEPGTGGDTDR